MPCGPRASAAIHPQAPFCVPAWGNTRCCKKKMCQTTNKNIEASINKGENKKTRSDKRTLRRERRKGENASGHVYCQQLKRRTEALLRNQPGRSNKSGKHTVNYTR
ncbi:unnamed protein product [Ectocarpus fasciculatus]